MTTEVKAYPPYGSKFSVAVHDTEYPNFEGRLALKLVEHFGVVCATDAGEDSAGRHQLRLMEPHDVVVRACEIAELMTNALRNRAWFVQAPSLEECERQGAKKEREPA